jgi:hypothetical protein
MNAIPTKYAGTQFRSLLEARWAAYFDLTETKWTYEPFELNGYIPDFLIANRLLETMGVVLDRLHEVKPATRIEQLYAHTAKLDASGWDGEFMLASSPDVALFRKKDRIWHRVPPHADDGALWNRANNYIQWNGPGPRPTVSVNVEPADPHGEGLADAAVAQMQPAEAWLVRYIVDGAPGLAEALATLTPEDIAPLRSANLLGAARAFAVEGLKVTRASLDGSLGDPERRLLNDVAVCGHLPYYRGHKSPAACVRVLRKRP